MLYRANKTASEAITKADQAILKADEANQAANRSAHAAEEATRETRRSVDAFIEAERGILHVHGLQVVEPFDGVRELHFIMENVGRSPLDITREWIEDEYLPPGEQAIFPIDPPFKFGKPMLQPIASGKQLMAGGTRIIGVEGRRPFPLKPIPTGAAWMVIRLVFQYRTMDEERYGGFTFAADTNASWMIRAPEKGNAFDVPIDFDFSSRP